MHLVSNSPLINSRMSFPKTMSDVPDSLIQSIKPIYRDSPKSAKSGDSSFEMYLQLKKRQALQANCSAFTRSTNSSVTSSPAESRSSFSSLHRRAVSYRSPIPPSSVTNAPLSFPISSKEALRTHPSHFTAFETLELQHFPYIYYMTNHSLTGRFSTAKGDHIAYRYEILEKLGMGEFGQVFKCVDHLQGQKVAVKVLNSHGADEGSILERLHRADPQLSQFVIELKDCFSFRNQRCLVLELMECDLLAYLTSHTCIRNVRRLRVITVQLLQGLNQLHKVGRVHSDVKPENIGMTSCHLAKLLDFGSSFWIGQEPAEYIQSRFYRAPEVVFGSLYGPAIDLWSLGCVLVELFIGRPLFPAANEIELIQMMGQVLGPPPESVRERISPKKNKLLTKCEGKRGINQVLHCKNAIFVDFLEKLLQWDWLKRLTAEEALKHPWVVKQPTPLFKRRPN